MSTGFWPIQIGPPRGRQLGMSRKCSNVAGAAWPRPGQTGHGFFLELSAKKAARGNRPETLGGPFWLFEIKPNKIINLFWEIQEGPEAGPGDFAS